MLGLGYWNSLSQLNIYHGTDSVLGARDTVVNS